MAAQETVKEASLSIKMEDKRLEEDIQSIMGVIQSKLVGKEMMIDQWDAQRGNLREFIEGARRTHEKLRKNAVKVLRMLDEAMVELEKAMVQQEDVQRIKWEQQSKQENIKKIKAKISKDMNDLKSLREDYQSKEDDMLEKKKKIRRGKNKLKILQESTQEDMHKKKEKLKRLEEDLQSKEEDMRKIKPIISRRMEELTSLRDDYQSKEEDMERIKATNMQIISSKQQEVRLILDKVKTRLQIPVTAKVLCWNIKGTGKAPIRNCLVPAVVRLVRPDILLLQEKDSEVIVGHCKKIKNYREKSTGPKKIIDSLVLYDADTYKMIQNEEKFFPDNRSLKEVIARSLTSSIEGIVPNECEENKLALKNVVNSRICYVGLKMQHFPASPIMIFISYHNNYKPDEGCDARETARIFCKLVSEIYCQSGCVVVAGADLNHQLSTRFRTELGATLIPYEVTERRSEKKKIDYFIVASDDTAEEVSVEVLNFIDTEESDFLHSLMSNPIPRPDSDGTIEFEDDDCSEALDHDPLLCELKINMQAKDEPEP